MACGRPHSLASFYSGLILRSGPKDRVIASRPWPTCVLLVRSRVNPRSVDGAAPCFETAAAPPPQHEAGRVASRKQNRGQALSAGDRCLVVGAPGVEQLHKLLAGAVIVPFAIAFDD